MNYALRNASLRRVTIFILTIALSPDTPSNGFTEVQVENDTGPVVNGQLTSEAANRGVEWLIENLHNMSVGRAFSTAHSLYRTVADEALAQRFLQIVRQVEKKRETFNLSKDYSGDEFLNWKTVDRSVKQIIRDRCQGRADEEIVQSLAVHIHKNGRSILDDLRLTNRIVAAFFLKELGIDCCNFYEETASELRYSINHPPQQNRIDRILHLYALTHLIFTRSGYYDHYLNQGQFETEAKALKKALPSNLERELSDLDIDITAEMLMALKLIRAPLQGDTKKLRHRLAALQNSDGSWGSSPTLATRAHNTLMSTMALIEFAPSFRGGRNIVCVP